MPHRMECLRDVMDLVCHMARDIFIMIQLVHARLTLN